MVRNCKKKKKFRYRWEEENLANVGKAVRDLKTEGSSYFGCTDGNSLLTRRRGRHCLIPEETR